MPGESNSELFRTIAEYVEALDNGQTPDRQQWLAKHPHLASDLEAFFSNCDDFGKALPWFSASSGVQETLDSNSAGPRNFAAGGRQSFGDYELLEELARGGMGIVYKARQTSLGRTVALKTILVGQHASEDDIQRFRTEAEAAAHLDHPSIVPIYEVGEADGQHYFSMAYIDGQSLSERIKQGPMPPRLAAELTRKVAEAIAYAHDQGIVHRDLKPANVLLDANDRPHVTDFGLAKRLSADEQLTSTGQILGTPGFMAPEQAAGRVGDVREAADIYALGALLYALLTGRPPFQADNPVDTILQVLEASPAPVRLLNAKVDSDLETICLKCLEKDPRDRYRDAASLAEDLGRYLDGETISVKSLNVLDRIVKTVQRSKHDVDLRAWGAMFYWFAPIVMLAEIGIYLHAWDGPPYPKHWGVIIRVVQFAVMGVVLWMYRKNWSVSIGAAERQMLSIWASFFVACHLVVALQYLLARPGQSIDEIAGYPYLAVVSGLTYFVMGSNYWGQCYTFGLVFFLLALLMPLHLPWAPLIFGAAWTGCLLLIGNRLRRLSATAA